MATIRKIKKIAFPTSGGTAVFDSDDFVYSVNNIKPNVANGDVHIDRVNNANHSDAATKVDQKVSASAVTNTAFPTNSSYVPDMSFLSFWNGAYNVNNSSYLKYCHQGEIIGSSNIAQQSVSHAVTADAATNVNQKVSASAAANTAFPAKSNYVPDMSFLTYWTGAFNTKNESYLRYCCQGEIIGSSNIAQQSVSHAVSADTATNVNQKVSANGVTNTAFPTKSNYVPDMSFLTYWNGAYNASNSSHLRYCSQGEIIGSSNIAKQSVSHAVTADNATNANNANHASVATTVDQRVSASAAANTAFPTKSSYVPDMSFLSFWNGAYNASNQSNLKYCHQGEIIGSSNIAQQSVSHAVTADRSGNAYNDEYGQNINGTYVKLGVSQNIAAQHNFPNGVRINGYLVTIE